MKWCDVARIVYGPIPLPDIVPHGMGTVPLSGQIQTVLTQVERFLSRSSEAEAVIRVFHMVVAALPNTKNIKLSLQPSVSGHSVFTDFLFLATDDASGWPLTFIEVKRFSDSADLSAQYESTAQTYREAHILLCESDWAHKGLKKLGFILSNSEMWSFAYAKKRANRIVITKQFTMHIRESRERVLFCLRSLLLGQWPLGENPASTSLPEPSTSPHVGNLEPLGENPASTSLPEPSTSPHVGNLDAPDHLQVMEECEALPPEPSTSPHVGDLDCTASTSSNCGDTLTPK